jgi:mannose-6-phosphate isomerase
MREICFLKNPIQDYAWGSHRAIPELLGEPSPSERPQAELWMGAHPKAPSEILVHGGWRPLPELIGKSPLEILGRRVAEKFSGQLPFLFKVLAAARPLSIQVHPNLDQAKAGFARENTLGIPLTAPNRNYRDNNHKPEIICALTCFWALNGFRRIKDMVSMLKEINPSELSESINAFQARPDRDGLKRFFGTVMTLERPRQQSAVADAVAFAEARADEDPVFEWIRRLHAQYPGDVGVLSPVLLNLVKLEPGQAMFLEARQLHAYLEGVGIELMANSDNVLRGGLTPKHIDVPELLNTLNFAEKDVVILAPEAQGESERIYPSEPEEFRLSVITVGSSTPYTSPEDRSIEIMICTSGKASVKNLESGEMIELNRGKSILVPAAVPKYSIEGQATLYKASVP